MDEYDEYIDWLIEEGALYYTDVVIDGERQMRMDPEKLKELCEPLYNFFLMEVDRTVIELVDEGLVEMEWSEEHGDFVSRLTDKGREVFSE